MTHRSQGLGRHSSKSFTGILTSQQQIVDRGWDVIAANRSQGSGHHLLQKYARFLVSPCEMSLHQKSHSTQPWPRLFFPDLQSATTSLGRDNKLNDPWTGFSIPKKWQKNQLTSLCKSDSFQQYCCSRDCIFLTQILLAHLQRKFAVVDDFVDVCWVDCWADLCQDTDSKSSMRTTR